MKNNMLKKLLVVSIGASMLLSSSIGVNADDCVHKDFDKDHICNICNIKISDHYSSFAYQATCINRAICNYCDIAYGDLNPNNHVGGTEISNTKEATCTEDGYTGDTHCKGCGTKLQDGNIIPATGHSGGTATCINKAICDKCGEEYGNLDFTNHVGDTEIRNAKEATCTEDGYTGDTYCVSCDSILQEGSIIPTTGHSGGTATCMNKAICDKCGEEYGDLDFTNHVGGTEISNTKEATCTEDGYTGDTYCKGCGTKLQDGNMIPSIWHSGGTATCMNKAICDKCSEEYGDINPENHVYEKVDQKDPTCTESGYSTHMKCTICGYEDGKEELLSLGHIDENKDHMCDRDSCKIQLSEHIGGVATCTTLAICDYCNNPYGEVDSTNHVGDTEIRNAKEATCTEDGYTGDTYCIFCDTKLLDGEIIPVTGHSGGVATCTTPSICNKCNKEYGEVNISNHVGDTEIRNAIPVTCEKDGYTGDTYCASCDTKLLDGEIIPATGHIDNNKDNKCDECNDIIIKETEKSTETPVVVQKETNVVAENNNDIKPANEAPKTGDETPVVAFSALAIVAFLSIIGLTANKRKNNK